MDRKSDFEARNHPLGVYFLLVDDFSRIEQLSVKMKAEWRIRR